MFLDQFDGRGFVNLARVLASFEPLLALCALAGVLAWAFGRRGLTRDALVVLAYVVPYTLVIGAYARTYERFVVQLLPFALVLRAVGPRVGAEAVESSVVTLLLTAVAAAALHYGVEKPAMAAVRSRIGR